MTKIQRSRSIAALALFSALSLPGSVRSASIFGTWTGIATSETTNYVFGVPVSESDSYGPATLGVGYMPQVYLGISINAAGGQSSAFTASFGPQSGSGSLSSPVLTPSEPVPRPSLEPTNPLSRMAKLDTSVGTASATVTIDGIEGNATGYITITSFQTVPEPTSLVELASGILAVLVIAWGRHFFCRRSHAFKTPDY